MNRALHSTLLALALALWAAAPAVADIVTERKVVEGLAFYLGIVPAEIVHGHPRGHEERVESIGLGGQEKTLEVMPIASAITYGNYFSMVGNGPFRIILQAARPG